jgi:NitT/TauT family transport system ATP-binding protein
MLPKAHISEVFGLLDIVKSYGGKTDVAKIGMDLRMDIDDLLKVVETAELFGLVSVDKGDIQLTNVAHKVMASTIAGRKKVLHEQLENVEVFSFIRNLLLSGGRLSKRQITHVLQSRFGPSEKMGNSVDLIVGWGCFARCFDYDGDSQRVTAKKDHRHTAKFVN